MPSSSFVPDYNNRSERDKERHKAFNNLLIKHRELSKEVTRPALPRGEIGAAVTSHAVVFRGLVLPTAWEARAAVETSKCVRVQRTLYPRLLRKIKII